MGSILLGFLSFHLYVCVCGGNLYEKMKTEAPSALPQKAHFMWLWTASHSSQFASLSPTPVTEMTQAVVGRPHPSPLAPISQSSKGFCDAPAHPCPAAWGPGSWVPSYLKGLLSGSVSLNPISSSLQRRYSS